MAGTPKKTGRRKRPKTSDGAENGADRVRQVVEELEIEENTWAPVDLGPILAGERTSEPPSILRREDGPCLLYPGKVHSLYGEPEAGKGWVVLAATAEQLRAGERVVYIDFEDDAETAVERLRALGVEDELIRDGFTYIRPDEPLKPGELSRAELDGALKPRPSLVEIDGLTEALAIEGIDLNSNSDVADWIVMFPRRVARATRAATVIIDHQAKDGDGRGRWAIGAQHKLAGVHVAYSIKAIKPFGRGLDGSSRINVEKDRPGHVRRHAEDRVVAEVQLSSDLESGLMAMKFEPPNAEAWRPTEKMEAISLVLENVAAGMSGRQIIDAVGGKEKTLKEAIRMLEAEGHIEVERLGTGKPSIHRSVSAYRAPIEGGEK